MDQSFILPFLKYPDPAYVLMDMKYAIYFFHEYVDTCICLTTTSSFKNIY